MAPAKPPPPAQHVPIMSRAVVLRFITCHHALHSGVVNAGNSRPPRPSHPTCPAARTQLALQVQHQTQAHTQITPAPSPTSPTASSAHSGLQPRLCAQARVRATAAPHLTSLTASTQPPLRPHPPPRAQTLARSLLQMKLPARTSLRACLFRRCLQVCLPSLSQKGMLTNRFLASTALCPHESMSRKDQLLTPAACPAAALLQSHVSLQRSSQCSTCEKPRGRWAGWQACRPSQLVLVQALSLHCPMTSPLEDAASSSLQPGALACRPTPDPCCKVRSRQAPAWLHGSPNEHMTPVPDIGGRGRSELEPATRSR